MEQLSVAFAAAFDDFDSTMLQPELRLEQIPGWDSMTSINLSLELQDAFAVSLDGLVLQGKQTVADVIRLLQERGAHVEGH